MSSSAGASQALVFGASGISGWSITRAAVLSKAPFNFSKIVGLTSRPLTIHQAALPVDSRLELHSGLDLTKGAEAITHFLSKIEGIENTTHVYFTGMQQALCLTTMNR